MSRPDGGADPCYAGAGGVQRRRLPGNCDGWPTPPAERECNTNPCTSSVRPSILTMDQSDAASAGMFSPDGPI
eukprot:6601921-Pyramimonas_sp.AAC.1